MIQIATAALSRFAQFAFRHPNMVLVLTIFSGAIALAVFGAVSLIVHPTMPKFAGIAITIAVLFWSTRRH